MNLSFFSKQHPKVFGLKLISSFVSGDFIDLHYYPTEDDYIVKRALPTQVRIFEGILEDILTMANLQALEVQLGDMIFQASHHFLRKVSTLKKLRFLQIESMQATDYEKRTGEMLIQDMPLLQTFEYKVAGGEASFEGDLSNLQEVTLYRVKFDLKNLLNLLNPEKLTLLNLRGCARYTKEEIAIAEVGKFKKLQKLVLADNKLRGLAFSVLDLPALEYLDLSDNLQFSLPAEAIHWDSLQKLGLSKTRTITQKYLKTGSDVVHILKDCRENKATPIQREMLFKILQNVNLPTTALSLEDWAGLYKVVTFLPLHLQLLALLEKYVTVSISAIYKTDKAFQICTAGKLQGLTNQDAKDKLKTYQIKQTNKITPQTALVCIGERANNAIVEQVVKDKIPFCTPIHLKRFLEELETPYLMEAETEVHDNLENLLQSGEAENRLLGLQLMRNGGIPPRIFGYLCLELFYPEANCKPEILALLRKYTSNEQYLFLLNAYRKQGDDIKPTTILMLISGDITDKNAIIEAVTHFYKPTKAETKDLDNPKYSFYTKFATRIWKKNPEPIWNAHFDELTGTLDLAWFREPLKKMPAYFVGKEEVRTVIRTVYHLQDIVQLKKYKNLVCVEVFISHFFAKSTYLQEFGKALPAHVNFKITFI